MLRICDVLARRNEFEFSQGCMLASGPWILLSTVPILPRVSLSDWGRVLRKRQLDDVHRQRPEFNAKYYWDARMHLVDDYVSQEMPVARFRLYGSPCLDVGQTVPVPDYAAFAIWLVGGTRNFRV